LIAFWLFADYILEELTFFGLVYFIWFIIGIALTWGGWNNWKKEKSKFDLTAESEKLFNIHYTK